MIDRTPQIDFDLCSPTPSPVDSLAMSPGRSFRELWAMVQQYRELYKHALSVIARLTATIARQNATLREQGRRIMELERG